MVTDDDLWTLEAFHIELRKSIQRGISPLTNHPIATKRRKLRDAPQVLVNVTGAGQALKIDAYPFTWQSFSKLGVRRVPG